MSNKTSLGFLIIIIAAAGAYFAIQKSDQEVKREKSVVNITRSVSDEGKVSVADESHQNISGNEGTKDSGAKNTEQAGNDGSQVQVSDPELDQLEQELSLELEDYDADANEISTFENDTSLDGIDDSLGNVSS